MMGTGDRRTRANKCLSFLEHSDGTALKEGRRVYGTWSEEVPVSWL